MPIMQGGVDITDQVSAEVEEKRRQRPLKADNAIVHLLHAKMSLENQPIPWLFDEIYDSIQKIDEIISNLQNANKGNKR